LNASENSNQSLGSSLMINGVQVMTERAVSRKANELHINLNGLTGKFKEGQTVHCKNPANAQAWSGTQ
jgi:hypothetical protein